MDEQQGQFGSFGSVSPDGMAAVKEALARRAGGNPMPALDTQSMASPTASPLPTQPIPQMAGTPSPTETVGKTPNSESKLIVSALKERLKAISQLEMGTSG